MIKPQTLAEVGDSQYFKLFGVSDAKAGKTTTFAASALGALPGQQYGLVSSPECLHIITFDEDAVNGLCKFLTESCKRPDCTKLTVWNMSKIAREAIQGEGYDGSMLNNILAIIQEVSKTANANPAKTYALLFSSWTGMGMALKHGIAGRPKVDATGLIKSSGMNPTKWDILNADLMTIRSKAHEDNKHVFWEGHIQTKFVMPTDGEQQKQTTTEETVGVPGGEGRNWALNVSEVTRMRREAVKYPDTQIDKMAFETRPTGDFVSNGRGWSTALLPKEYDLAVMATKLGKKVGGYKKP